MAGKNRSLYATISLRANEFISGLKKASESSDKFKSDVKKQFDQVKNTVGGLGSMAKTVAGAAAAYIGFREAKDFVTDCATGVMDLERANKRLETLMLNTSGNTKEMVSDLIAYGDQLELVTSIEGDATVAGASQLATFQLQGNNIKTLLPALQNLAVGQYGVNVTQENMISSANLLGKVMMGQTGALSKAGVSFSAAQEKILKIGTEAEKTATLVEVLDQNFGGLAESMAQTDEGRLIQLRNAWGSVKDEIGYAVMPAIRTVVQYLAENIPNIRQTISDVLIKITPRISQVANLLKNGFNAAGKVIGFVLDNLNWLGPTIAIVVGAVGALTAAQWAFNLAMTANPIGAVVAAAVALVGIGVAIYKNWDKIKEKFPALASGVENLIGGIKELFISAVNFIKPILEAFAPYFQVILNGLFSIFQNILNQITNVFRFWAAVFRGDWNGAWEAVKSIFANVWNGLSGIVKGAVNGIIIVMNSMISGAVSGINGLISGINNISGKVGIPAIPTLTAPQIPMLAHGGIIRRGGTVLVGEKGPEFLNLNRGASVTPLDNSSHNTNNNTFYINIDARGQENEAIDDLVRKVKFALSNM